MPSPLQLANPASPRVKPSTVIIPSRLIRWLAFQRIVLICGWCLALLGLLVVCGWLTKFMVLVQVLPDAVAMQFNTAALFLLTGMSLISRSRGSSLIATLLGAAIASFAALTASQDLLRVELGIDHLLPSDWLNVGANPSGRMAINTAFCFVLTGLVLTSSGCRGWCRIQPLLEGLAGSIVMAVGLASSAGYCLGIEGAYAWGSSIGMAIHTALGFLLCGGVLILLACNHERVWCEQSPKWLPFCAAALVLTVSIVYWQALRTEYATAQSSHTVIDALLAIGLLRATVFALLVYFFQQSRYQLGVAARAAAALRDSEQRFRAIFDQTFQFIGLMATDGTVLEANRTALSFAGLTERDVVGKPFWETPWWAHSPELQAKLRDATSRASRGEFVRFEATHPDQDGQIHSVDFSLKPVLDDHGNVLLLIPEGRDITEQKRAEVELLRLAWQDKLTGLPNRALVMERLRHVVERANRQQRYDYGLLFLDFDRFKFVNDRLGHAAGDELLVAIAARLRSVVGPGDGLSCNALGSTAARLGGDEFVVLLNEASAQTVMETAETLLAALAESYQLAGHDIHSTASIGIVLGDANYRCAEEVIRDADSAMYAAKRAGKARYVVFDAQMRAALQRRLQLEDDLRLAIERNELSLVYQPVQSLSSGEMRSVEAAACWLHATGEIDPAEFLSIAEESDQIQRLGDWLLASVCRQFVHWQRALGPNAPGMISLNLSYKQFRDPHLPAKIQRALLEHGLQPSSLELEISESTLASDEGASLAIVHALRKVGVQLSIDDFGIGSAFLASVQRFPIDTIKVHRSMLVDLETSQDSAALMHALAVLVRNMGVNMVADGVESPAQAMALQELGCGFAQGDFLSPALSAAEFEDFLPHHSGIWSESPGAMTFANCWSRTMQLSLEPA